MIVVSLNVDFDESSTSCCATDPKQNLENLGEAFGVKEETHGEETPTYEEEVGAGNKIGDMSKWESDDETL